MTELRSQAVVLRVRSFKEADKLVTLLTRDAGQTVARIGKQTVICRFAGAADIGETLHQGRSLTLLSGK